MAAFRFNHGMAIVPGVKARPQGDDERRLPQRVVVAKAEFVALVGVVLVTVIVVMLLAEDLVVRFYRRLA